MLEQGGSRKRSWERGPLASPPSMPMGRGQAPSILLALRLMGLARSYSPFWPSLCFLFQQGQYYILESRRSGVTSRESPMKPNERKCHRIRDSRLTLRRTSRKEEVGALGEARCHCFPGLHLTGQQEGPVAKAALGYTSYPRSQDGDFVLDRRDFPSQHS